MAKCDALNTRIERDLCVVEEKLSGVSTTVEGLTKQPGNAAADTLTLVFDNLDKVLLLAGVIAAYLGLWLLYKFLNSQGATVKEATISIGGSSITVERAAQKISQLLEDVQDYVIGQAATARRDAFIDDIGKAMSLDAATIAKLKTQTADGQFSDKPAEAVKLPKLEILWVSDNTDIIEFEQSVIKRMGHNIEQVESNPDAVERLRTGNRYDLILSDIFRETDPIAGLRLFEMLVTGIKPHGWREGGETARLGATLRYAAYTWPKRIGRIEPRMQDAARRAAQAELGAGATDAAIAARQAEIMQNALITPDFAYLQDRIRWIARSKLPKDANAGAKS